jgi:hypothetical protein
VAQTSTAAVIGDVKSAARAFVSFMQLPDAGPLARQLGLQFPVDLLKLGSIVLGNHLHEHFAAVDQRPQGVAALPVEGAVDSKPYASVYDLLPAVRNQAPGLGTLVIFLLFQQLGHRRFLRFDARHVVGIECPMVCECLVKIHRRFAANASPSAARRVLR